MISTLMFHRVHASGFPGIDVFEGQLASLASQGQNCLPGDHIPWYSHGICLTFDDAYFDFYYYIYPLLQKYHLKAVLAIPTALIADHVDMSDEERLAMVFERPLDNDIRNNPSLCSWQEIKEMVDSGWVIPAAHGATHQQLDEKSDIHAEVIVPKNELKQRLGIDVNTFVYPYGRFNDTTHNVVRQHYQFIMRIGSANNFNWHNNNQLIYRINADDFWPQQLNPLPPMQHAKNTLRLCSNMLRGK